MHVLSVTPLFPSSAAPAPGVFVKERLKNLPSDVRTTVVRCRPHFPLVGFLKPHLGRSFPAFETVEGLPVHDLRFPYVPGAFKAQDGDRLGRALIAFVERHGADFDLFDAHFTHPTGCGAVIAAARFGRPTVITERGTIGSYLGDGRRGKMRAALLAATRLVAVSESLARIMREVAGKDLDVRVIGNGVDAARFAPGDCAQARRALGLEGRGPVLLTVGGLVPRKGVMRVIEILPEILAKHPEAVYVVVGAGGAEGDYEAACRAAVGAKGLEGSIRFEGAVAPAALPDYYRAADVFCLSTTNEGWANVLQESLAVGTPVVTTDVGGNREVVGSPDHGIVCRPADATALCDALLAALGTRWDRSAISAWGRRRDWRDVGLEVEAVFREALGAH